MTGFDEITEISMSLRATAQSILQLERQTQVLSSSIGLFYKFRSFNLTNMEWNV